MSGGEGYSRKVHRGRLHPEVQPLSLIPSIFHKKGTLFVYLLLTNGTVLTQLVQNFTSVLTNIM